MPQLKDARAPREFPAITTHNQNNHTIRTEQWRYIRYADGSEELYDETTDPNEWTNLAHDPGRAAVKQELARWLPKNNAHAAPGSASRVLTYDNGKPVWEDEAIEPDDDFPLDVLIK
nr:sulfatase/phosphatase domain-containing protein [Verrucomicrobium spinosum]